MFTRRSVMLGGVAMAGFVSAGRAVAAVPRDIVVMAKQIDDLISVDPQESFEYSGGELTGNIYQRLVTSTNEEPTKLIGQLAESWDVGPDGKTYTFHLRQGPKFSSGKPVTAEDAAFSLHRAVLLDKPPGFIITQFGLNKSNVETAVKALDARTLQIVLPEAFAPTFLLNCLSASIASVVEKAVVMANQKDGDLGNGWLKTNSAGSGFAVLRSWRASELVTLEVNPHYDGEKPAWKRVMQRHTPDPLAQVLALQHGDVDIARNLGPDQLRSIADDASLQVKPASRASLLSIGLNQSHPILAKPQVRQAIKWAIDYNAIEKNIVANTWKTHQSFLPAGFPAALMDKPFQKDVAKAKALLAEAGHADGFDISMDHFSIAPFADIAQAVQANLAEVGIRVTLRAGESRAIITRSRARQHEMSLGRWGADYFDPNTNSQNFCENPDNSDSPALKTSAWRNSWQDLDITRRSQAAVREQDANKRIEMYLALQRDVQERSPFVFLLQEIEVPVMTKSVSGFDVGTISDRTSYLNLRKA